MIKKKKIAMQAWAVASGLASGETEANGWQWVLLLFMLGGYTLAMIVLGLGGIRLVRIVNTLSRDQ